MLVVFLGTLLVQITPRQAAEPREVS